MALMHRLNADPEVKGESCADGAWVESESQMTEATVEGRDVLKMQIPHWAEDQMLVFQKWEKNINPKLLT